MPAESDDVQGELGIQEKIKSLIRQGEFGIGEKISEDLLVQRLGVGVARVRRALDTLAVIGIVQIRPRIGTFVFSVDAAEFEHLNAVRSLLECAAIQTAMSVNADRFVAALRENLRRAEAIDLADGNRRAYRELDREFHRMAFVYAGNRYLSDAYEVVDIKVWAMRSQLTFPESHVSTSLNAHREVVQLLENGEIEQAGERLREHIRKSFSALARSFLSNPAS